MSASDVATMLGISQSHFYQLLKSGRLPLPVQLGRSRRWIREELVAWLNAGCPNRAKWQVIKAKHVPAIFRDATPS
jgi:excisionase family DNA binding protein